MKHSENQEQRDTQASQNAAEVNDGSEPLTEKQLDEVTGGAHQYYVSVEGTKQGQVGNNNP